MRPQKPLVPRAAIILNRIAGGYEEGDEEVLATSGERHDGVGRTECKDCPCPVMHLTQIDPNTMKKLLMMTAMTCVIALPTMTAFADATTAQKEQIERASKEVSEAMKTDEGCDAMCQTMMKNEKSKKMMCEMVMKDPECMKMMMMKQ